MTNPEIRFVINQDIDLEKWDQCIANSPDGIAYAYSWYLNRICSGWDALVLGDYQYIMPLVNRSKFGVRYIYQPFFTQQLGVFSNAPITSQMVSLFLSAIPGQFRLADMNLNTGNSFDSEDFNTRKNKTYHLNLNRSLPEIQSGYNINTKRNIQKAVKNAITVSPVNDPAIFIKFTQTNLAAKSPEIKSLHYDSLQKLISYCLSADTGELTGAFDSSGNLVSAVFFVTANKKTIYLAASSNTIGIEQSAMFHLVDHFISRHANKDLILDFEGSNIPGVARFYEGFGAVPKIYTSVRINRLPAVLRLLKK